MLNYEFTRMAKFIASAEESYTRLRPRSQEVRYDWIKDEVREALHEPDRDYLIAVLHAFGKGKQGLIINYKALTKAINAKEFPQPKLKDGYIWVFERKESK